MIATDLANFLALAQLVAETTGAPRERCISSLMELYDLPKMALPVVEKPPPAPANGTGRPFDGHEYRKHLHNARPGTQYTTDDVLSRLHMTMPRGAKRAAIAMRDEGWTLTGKMRDGRPIYQKPVEQVEGHA